MQSRRRGSLTITGWGTKARGQTLSSRNTFAPTLDPQHTSLCILTPFYDTMTGMKWNINVPYHTTWQHERIGVLRRFFFYGGFSNGVWERTSTSKGKGKWGSYLQYPKEGKKGGWLIYVCLFVFYALCYRTQPWFFATCDWAHASAANRHCGSL